MNNTFSFKIFASADDLPDSWNDLSKNNIFLSQNYLRVLENSSPTNMHCNFIGIFNAEKIIGIALTQMISTNGKNITGEKKSCLQTKIRDFTFKYFASNVLFVGNNMLTGQNAFIFDANYDFNEILKTLHLAVKEIEAVFASNRKKIHILNYKDFIELDLSDLKTNFFKDFYKFEIQPNMVFSIPTNWNSNEDYILALSKKYRDQYKRSHKKADKIIKCKLSLKEIIIHNDRIYELYMNVTKNAPFNTFFLSENHFIEFKKQLDGDFLFYGYFLDDILIGFNTLIKNGDTIDTYFLGYDDNFQREKMLYLNMLYDMIGYSINKKFKKIIFARTALEIKSSVGAKPLAMFGFVKHNNKIINKFMPRLFKYFEPEVVWQERNPFKEKL